ncbi:isochorismatase family protein [Niveispirillum sp. KHB5.9]|uniref:isochorismatase family protein n=1 Tax=Niveispirillum sp. KHB5.9 TaxID=3400269 RepID=UPI003A8B9E04
MSARDTALLVVDVQESFRQRAYWNDAEAGRFFPRIQALIDGAKTAGLPIAQIFHVDPDGPFSKASGHVKLLSPVRIEADTVFEKTRHSALVGSGLDVWLVARGIRRVIVCGIRTEQCCETTTRHASDLGYEVDYVTEATLTFAMTDAAGRTWSADEIRARTELVLAGRFATITNVEQALARAVEGVDVQEAA